MADDILPLINQYLFKDYSPKPAQSTEMTYDFLNVKSYYSEFRKQDLAMKDQQRELDKKNSQVSTIGKNFGINEKLLTLVFKNKIARRYKKSCFKVFQLNLK